MQPFHRLHPNRGKNILVDLDTFRSGRVYFAKTGCKIEDGFMDIFGVQVMCFVLDWTGRLGLTFTTGLFIRFAAKREKQLNPFFMAQPSLFFPYFDFTLMNVYMNTGIK